MRELLARGAHVNYHNPDSWNVSIVSKYYQEYYERLTENDSACRPQPPTEALL